eukprot:COSAG01_NODE_5790_length_4033_cov_7.794865_2_plen_67_part_00
MRAERAKVGDSMAGSSHDHDVVHAPICPRLDIQLLVSQLPGLLPAPPVDAHAAAVVLTCVAISPNF